MAALVAGVQYGLSSHSNFHENKSLIFVKLTDSAYRAIEDYIKNRSKTNQNPTIQFLGNEGQLSFPSTQSSHGSADFTFSLSGNHDIEGPQGAFECIQQTGSKSLESLGTMPCKMRIQANDDVYETTRHRMAVAEENNKNKCTRVIKPNGPDIGRKVKVKTTGRTIPPPSNARHREPTSSNNNISNSSIPGSTNQSSRVNPYSSNSSSSGVASSSLSYKRGGSGSNPPTRTQPEKKLSELARRPLKERLIHVLALRTYKKPELYDRLQREGLKERDRSALTTILKEVASIRENVYHLRRHEWDNVRENWPFYSEQDKAMLKRRKPQNLTPPGQSSDGGSSGSGQSPNSVHPGSPPTIIAGSSVTASKRPGYYQGNDGIQTKKPRISHYRKPEFVAKTTTTTTTTTQQLSTSGNGNGNSNSNINNNGSNNSVNGGGGNDINNWNNDNGRQHRTDYQLERITNNSEVLRGSYGTNKSCLTPTSDCEDNVNSNRYTNNSVTSSSSLFNPSHVNNVNHNAYNSVYRHQNNVSGNDSKMMQSVSGVGESNSSNINNSNSADYLRSGGVNSSANNSGGNNNSYISPSNGVQLSVDSGRRDGRKDRSERNREREKVERERERDKDKNNDLRDNNNSAANSYNDFTNLGASNYNNISPASSILSSTSLPNSVSNSSTLTSMSPSISTDSKEYPDYLTQYTTISSADQRKRYKAEFTADYEEYRRLHAVVAQVSGRFAHLEEMRQKEINSGNDRNAEELRRRIIEEYINTKSDPTHIETKKRFHYLHEKLSHIKRLVLEYDTQYNNSNDIIHQTNNDGSILKGGGLRY